MKKFKVKINQEFEFLFTEDDLVGLDVKELSEDQVHVLYGNRSRMAAFKSADIREKRYEIQIDSDNFSVEIDNDLDLLIEEMGLEVSASTMIDEIHAPMPGLILEVSAEAGQEVKKGDFLMVLEAMKMENTITAPRDGVLRKIHVVKGQTVGKKDLLIEFD